MSELTVPSLRSQGQGMGLDEQVYNRLLREPPWVASAPKILHPPIGPPVAIDAAAVESRGRGHARRLHLQCERLAPGKYVVRTTITADHARKVTTFWADENGDGQEPVVRLM